MPYIDQDRRAAVLNDPVKILSEGELNFLITRLLVSWLGKKPNYSDINAAIGVLECAKLELYRRVAVPYEAKKCHQNGDVYLTRVTAEGERAAERQQYFEELARIYGYLFGYSTTDSADSRKT